MPNHRSISKLRKPNGPHGRGMRYTDDEKFSARYVPVRIVGADALGGSPVTEAWEVRYHPVRWRDGEYAPKRHEDEFVVLAHKLNVQATQEFVTALYDSGAVWEPFISTDDGFAGTWDEAIKAGKITDADIDERIEMIRDEVGPPQFVRVPW